MHLITCAVYLAFTGALGFFIGRILPKRWFDPERFPYRSFSFEKNGKFYAWLRISKWQSKVPDMSRILPGLMPAKNLHGDYVPRLRTMLAETCIAELIHWCLSVTGCLCLVIWPGPGGVIITLVHAFLLNLPFILIQRYNRPRLLRLLKKHLTRQQKKGLSSCEL